MISVVSPDVKMRSSVLEEQNLLRMSQVSCDEFRLRAPRIDLPLQSVERPPQRGVVARERRREEGHRGPEEPRSVSTRMRHCWTEFSVKRLA